MTTTQTPKAIARNAEIDQALDVQMFRYEFNYDGYTLEQRNLVIPPYRVRDAIRSHVAKTGKVRFKKGLPPMHGADGELNEAYLFWLYKAHTGYGAYRSIDSLVMARWTFDSTLCERWERTVDVMHHLDRLPSSMFTNEVQR